MPIGLHGVKDDEFKFKNDYTCNAFMGSRKVHTLIYVNKISDMVKDLDDKGIEWSVINVYTRRTERFLRRFYKKYHYPNIPARHDQ